MYVRIILPFITHWIMPSAPSISIELLEKSPNCFPPIKLIKLSSFQTFHQKKTPLAWTFWRTSWTCWELPGNQTPNLAQLSPPSFPSCQTVREKENAKRVDYCRYGDNIWHVPVCIYIYIHLCKSWYIDICMTNLRDSLLLHLDPISTIWLLSTLASCPNFCQVSAVILW